MSKFQKVRDGVWGFVVAMLGVVVVYLWLQVPNPNAEPRYLCECPCPTQCDGCEKESHEDL